MTNIQNLSGPVTFQSDSLQEQLQKGGVTLVDFWAEWCGPCRALAPAIQAVAERYAGKATVGKLEIDHAQDLASELGVSSIPTLIVFKDGKPVDRLVGLVAQDAIAEKLDQWL